MPGRGLRGGTALLSLQMQRQHQVCPPGLLGGMAVAFPEEVL